MFPYLWFLFFSFSVLCFEFKVISKDLITFTLTGSIINHVFFNPSSANLTKWSNTLKQFVGKLLTNCLSVFHHFVGLALKGSILFSLFQTILKNMLPKRFSVYKEQHQRKYPPKIKRKIWICHKIKISYEN